MQKYILKYLFLASIFAFSCGKTEHFKVVKPFISMDINNKAWVPDSIKPLGMYSAQYVLEDTTFQVSMEAGKYFFENGEAYPTEAFIIYLLKKKLGKQTIYGAPTGEIFYNHRHPSPTTPIFAIFQTRQEYNELVCEDFIVDNSKASENWIEITHEEGNFKRIWGKFNINLKRTYVESGCIDVKYTDDTKISNGEFFLEL